MKLRTSELTGPALGWASAVADKRQVRSGIGGSVEVRGRTESNDELPEDYDLWMFWYPQANWSQGGPIIEREHIALDYYHTPIHPDVQPRWEARHGIGVFEYGPTPLIAAMRCYVASKLGDEVEIPEELVT